MNAIIYVSQIWREKRRTKLSICKSARISYTCVWSSAWSLSFSDSPWCVWSGSDADRCFAHPALSPWGLRPLQDTSSYAYGLRLRMAMRAWLLCSGRDTIRSPMEWWTTAGLLVVLQDCCGVWLFVALARRIVFMCSYGSTCSITCSVRRAGERYAVAQLVADVC